MEHYVEIVEKSISKRGTIIPIKNVSIKKVKYQRYISLFYFDDMMLKHIEKTNSMSNFTGDVGIKTIWIDFDNEDNIEEARQQVVKFLDNMQKQYGFAKDYLPVYFSGGKGFHVGIPAKVVNLDGVMSSNLPTNIKNFVMHITKDISFVDYVIYNHTRIMRLPYSYNTKGKKYKVYVSHDELRNNTTQEIMDKATNCEDIFYPPKIKYEVNSYMYRDYMNCCEDKPTTKIIDVATNNGASSLFSVPEKGKRNDTLFKQAFRLFSIEGLKTNEVHDIMNAFCRLTSIDTGDRITQREFTSLINSAYKRAGNGSVASYNMNTLESLTYDVYDIISKSACVPTGLAPYDEDLGGGLKLGNLYAFIGKAGTKKSIVAHMIAIKSAMEGSPVVYFNMEMSAVELFRRTALRLMDIDLYEGIRDGRITETDLPDIKEKLNTFLNNNFYSVDNSDLTTGDFCSIIEKVEEDTKKKVKLVVIDSMNAMKTVGGSEVMTAFENTKKLKELAKLKNVAVVMINHVTAACMLHIRDTSLFARGGQKIMDNCDAWFSISKCIDPDNSRLDGDNSDYIYLNDVIFMRFHNKRESGNTIDTIIRMDNNLSINLLNVNPKGYEV